VSHFYAVVLVPRESTDIEYEVKKLLASYDEDIQVEEYDKKCWCVNREARSAGWKAAEDKFGSFNDLRESYWKKIKIKIPSHIKFGSDEYWRRESEAKEELDWGEFTSHFTSYSDQFTKNHPDYDKPSLECDECSGGGTYKSNYNPDSKWDWWVIGGRWDGVINSNPRDDRNGGFNFGDEHHQLKHNTISTVDYLKTCKEDNNQYPFALVTPNGEWCEKGKMGWFAMVADEKEIDNWNDTVNYILEKYNDCIAVGCDLHI